MAGINKPSGAAPAGYRVVARGKRAEIYLYGVIGIDWFDEGVTAKQFAKDLKDLGAVDQIDVRINSDGGSVTDARAIYTLLVEHPAEINVHVDGIAASAASFLAMAGKTITVAEGGFIMIHNARMGCFGEAEDHIRAATVLETVNETIRETYIARTNQGADKIKKWMDAETWFTGKEAVQYGFADRLVENMRVAACVRHPEAFKAVPSHLRPKRAAAAAALASMSTLIK